MNANAKRVVAQFDRMLQRDGGALSLVAEREGALVLHYDKGKSECESCVMAQDDFRAMILEALTRLDPSIVSVRLTTETLEA